MVLNGIRTVLVTALCVASSCNLPGPSRLAEPAPTTTRNLTEEALGPTSKPGPVVLVTIDGVRWQEVFRGTDPAFEQKAHRTPKDFMPNLTKLAQDDGATIGAPGHGTISATGPNFVSLPGYTELLSGRPSVDCQTNGCSHTESPTLLDDAHAAGAKVAAFGSWEMLDRALTWKPGTFPVSCGRNGNRAIDPWPGTDDFRPDALTGPLALAHLEREKPDLLFVGLGEPDEHAHRGDYEGYIRAIAQADKFIGQLRSTLARMGERGRATHIFVTADHGRSSSFNHHGREAPESARVWLIAAGPSVEARGDQTSKRERHLADVAPTLRRVLALAPAPMRPDSGRPIGELLGEKSERLNIASAR